MTTHRAKPTITTQRVAWFANYFAHNGAWGVFHVSLDDGNYDLGAADEWQRPGTNQWDLTRDEWQADVREAADWFDTLTQSQRKRLGRKAEARGHGEATCPRC